MDDDDLRLGIKPFHLTEMIRIPNESELLCVERKVKRVCAILTPASIQITSARQIKGDIIGQLFHAAHVNNTREGSRCEFIGHERHIAAAGPSCGIDATIVVADVLLLQTAADQPEGTQSIKSLQVSEIIGLRPLNRIYLSALQVVDADRNHIQLSGHYRWRRGADTISSPPVVQRQHQSGVLLNTFLRSVRKVNQDANLSRTRTK